jgi:hypothetical protein
MLNLNTTLACHRLQGLMQLLDPSLGVFEKIRAEITFLL